MKIRQEVKSSLKNFSEEKYQGNGKTQETLSIQYHVSGTLV